MPQNRRQTIRSVGEVARRQRLKDSDVRELSPGAMLSELRSDNLRLREFMLDAHALCERHDDVASASVLKIGSMRLKGESGSCLNVRATEAAEKRGRYMINRRRRDFLAGAATLLFTATVVRAATIAGRLPWTRMLALPAAF